MRLRVGELRVPLVLLVVLISMVFLLPWGGASSSESLMMELCTHHAAQWVSTCSLHLMHLSTLLMPCNVTPSCTHFPACVQHMWEKISPRYCTDGHLTLSLCSEVVAELRLYQHETEILLSCAQLKSPRGSFSGDARHANGWGPSQ